MKSYLSDQRICVQGKAWQVRIILAQLSESAGPKATLYDLLQQRRKGILYRPII